MDAKFLQSITQFHLTLGFDESDDVVFSVALTDFVFHEEAGPIFGLERKLNMFSEWMLSVLANPFDTFHSEVTMESEVQGVSTPMDSLARVIGWEMSQSVCTAGISSSPWTVSKMRFASGTHDLSRAEKLSVSNKLEGWLKWAVQPAINQAMVITRQGNIKEIENAISR